MKVKNIILINPAQSVHTQPYIFPENAKDENKMLQNVTKSVSQARGEKGGLDPVLSDLVSVRRWKVGIWMD